MKRFLILYFLIFSMVVTYASQDEQSFSDSQKEVIKSSDNSKIAKYLGAGLAIGVATFGSGIAVGRIGSAAMGAISEKPESTGTALIMVALAEGICLWGIAGAFIILFF
jgi:V/A-type H+-transporting ATPase subunit K